MRGKTNRAISNVSSNNHTRFTVSVEIALKEKDTRKGSDFYF